LRFLRTHIELEGRSLKAEQYSLRPFSLSDSASFAGSRTNVRFAGSLLDAETRQWHRTFSIGRILSVVDMAQTMFEDIAPLSSTSP
jgi:hypothetical protein